ncbi:MAG: hypothetical protein IKT56_00545 [Clostridia bacterium]|nr:hypothetical protein [Clostridia bacterium]
MKKIIAMLLAVVLVLSVMLLVACGDTTTGNGGEGEDTKTNVSKDTQKGDDKGDDTGSSGGISLEDYLSTYNPEETAEAYVEVEDQDFGGHEFRFLNTDSVYYMYVYLDPDMTGDILDNTCYKRNKAAEKKFNITITEETQTYEKLNDYARTLILSGEDIYDAMFLSSPSSMVYEELFYDLLEIEELNIDRVWWDQPLIQYNTIEDRLFYATSDLHLMAFESIWCMYFNENMMLELGLDLPFDLALDGEWTFEEFEKYCAEAANLNGDTSFTLDANGNAQYGVISIDRGPTYMAYGMKADTVSRDDNGKYYFSADTDPHFTTVWEQLTKLWGPNDGRATLHISGGGDLGPGGYFEVFMDNRALFLEAELKGATMLRQWDGSFGLMPIPKYDVDQENYESCVFSGAAAFVIPETNQNLSRTGMIVDYLTYESYKSLLPRYYDIHVAVKALERQESIDVLSILRGTRGYSAAHAHKWNNDLETTLQNNAHANVLAIASAIEAVRDACISSIETTYKEYPSLIHTDN